MSVEDEGWREEAEWIWKDGRWKVSMGDAAWDGRGGP